MVLTDHINAEYVENLQDYSGAIHPSSLDACDRKAVYQYLGLEKDVEHAQYLKRIFFQGHHIEEWMNHALQRKGILIASGVVVCAEIDGVPVEGMIDHIVEHEDGWRIADTKSIAENAIRWHKDNLPYRHHELQLAGYGWMFREFCKRDLDTIFAEVGRMKDKRGIRDKRLGCPYISFYGEEKYFGPEYPPALLYVGRGSLEEMPPIEIDRQAEAEVLARMAKIARHINEGTIPDRPFAHAQEHRYLCGQAFRREEFRPGCEWFYRCWGKVGSRPAATVSIG